MERRGFADLPSDLLLIIADRAAVDSRVRMRAVCSAWRAVVPIVPQPPWILLPAGDDDDDADEDGGRGSFSVLSLPASRKLSPGSSVVRCLNNTFPAGSRCVGAGHGWLALVATADLSVTLINPVAGRTVSLPPLTRHPIVGGLRDEDRRLVLRRTCLKMNHEIPLPVEDFIDMVVWKMVFSTSPEEDSYFAVLVCDHERYATYAKNGATEWKMLRYEYKWGLGLEGPPVSLVNDVVHVGGGKFLAQASKRFDDNDGKGEVIELDLNNKNPAVHDDDSPSVRLFANSTALLGIPSTHTAVENHLVRLADGKLYLIWVSWVRGRPGEDEADLIHRRRVKDARAVRWDPDRCTCWSSKEEAAADFLDDWSVLIGKNETAAVRLGDVPGLSAGCLYFIDVRWDEMLICTFDLRSGQQVETASGWADLLRAATMFDLSDPSPFWFLPSAK